MLTAGRGAHSQLLIPPQRLECKAITTHFGYWNFYLPLNVKIEGGVLCYEL
jgi:hypothetical protein